MVISDYINFAIAVGTVSSCIIALWLAYDSKRKKLDCVFMWGEKGKYAPILSINNICDKTIILEEIVFKYKGQVAGRVSLLWNSGFNIYSVIEAHSKTEIPLNKCDLFSNIELNVNDSTKQKLSIIVKSTTGKTFKSSYYYSDEDICVLFFWEGMCAE